jgi:hypothetical protein
MKTSPKMKSVSKSKKPSTSKVGRPSAQGHIYEIISTEPDKLLLNNRGDRRVIEKLKDLTENKEITRSRVAKMIGNYSPIWLDSLERHSEVYVAVEFHGTKCKIVPSPHKKGQFWLNDIGLTRLN